MQSLTDSQRAPLRRRAIIDAALECFTAQGYAATTIDDIRVRSGASIGSLYHHFDGKEAIAQALYLDRLTVYETAFLDALEVADDAETGITATVHRHLEWAETNPDDARFLLGHADIEQRLARQGGLPEANRAFYDRVGVWVRHHISMRVVRALPADLFYALWLGPAQELTRQWLNGRAPTAPSDAGDLLAATAWNALTITGEHR